MHFTGEETEMTNTKLLIGAEIQKCTVATGAQLSGARQGKNRAVNIQKKCLRKQGFRVLPFKP